jgi:hypothetical protein
MLGLLRRIVSDVSRNNLRGFIELDLVGLAYSWHNFILAL